MYEMRKISGPKQKTTIIVITHHLKKYDVESFRKDIINANWEDAINNKDINLASHLWEKNSWLFWISTPLNDNVKLGLFAPPILIMIQFEAK